MRVLFALILSLISFESFCQPDSLTVYNRSELVDFDPDTIYAISYNRMKLEQIPDELSKFTNLIYLDLSKNKLTSLNDQVAELRFLEILNLEKNKLENFPVQFCRMQNLKDVIINRNQIESIPNCIENMSSLEYLDLYDNPIRSLPNTLPNLKNIKEIDFSGIRFSPSFQDAWTARMPHANLIFDAPCDCME